MDATVGPGSDEKLTARPGCVRTLDRVDVAEAGNGSGDERAPLGPVTLAEPVRQRLTQLAAEVLGRLPAEDVPAALRPFAKFTPAKRIRLGAAALAAVLDTDEDFRARVGESVATATPQLVDAVREGAATPASDPYDRAVVAYLVRPAGWEQIVAEVNAGWSDERAGRDAVADENARLRAEVAELRARLKSQAASQATHVDEAVTAASAAVNAEATRLRNTLRARTGELRAAEQAVEQARSELDRVRGDAGTATGELTAEVAALRARIGELERAAEASRREVRTERDVADARLRLLIDTLTDAAAGIRRELALPAGSLRPADLVAATGDRASDRGAEHAVHAAGLDRLLELPQVHLIIDGYNVTKTGYPELPLADQRARLVTTMAAVQARCGAEVTVVFDGGTRPPAQSRMPRGVRVLFSAPDESADDLIRRLVRAEPAGRPLVVVTSDREIVSDVRHAGAWTVPSSVLLDRLRA
jgi:predicted RNA-binding protein with PIN domain